MRIPSLPRPTHLLQMGVLGTQSNGALTGYFSTCKDFPSGGAFKHQAPLL